MLSDDSKAKAQAPNPVIANLRLWVCAAHAPPPILAQVTPSRGPIQGITITKDGDEDYTRIPCLAFADDVVLMAETAADMQHLMNICTEEASRDNFKFNAENTYSVGRILWKTLAVPAVTYANDALTYSAAGIKGLDRHQYELGRWLLGGSSCTANTAVTGEMG
ncbi:hypothetical protein HPB47_010732 [Ixodes persulcatus]|uniref:Uncharacterized protein n=1 Tax=Ixodes persulcatus TaxID=34615 RepID=A0AC60NYI7_IXOPE|nr:hypothetical protein HPB47_010732 [Ixodes persulcatus]